MPFQSPIASYGNSLLPIITTKKIHVSSKDKIIKVDFGINIPGNAAYRRNLLSSEVVDMYYFYFIILDDSNANLLGGLKDPNIRSNLISSIHRGEYPNILSSGALKKIKYRDILETHSTVDYNLTDLTNDYNNEFRSSVDINYMPKMSKITLTTSTTPRSSGTPIPFVDYYWRGQGTADFIGRARDTGWVPGQPRGSGTTASSSRPGFDIVSENEEVTYGGHAIDYEYLSTDNLHLVCFVDLDLTGDRPPFTGNDIIHYDLLLTRDAATGRLNVPKQILSYYVNEPTPSDPFGPGYVESGASENRPYHGGVHYHDENNPHPEDPNYVGWMANSVGGVMGPKLIRIATPNYKITSDLKVYEDQPLFATNLDSISPSWMSENLLPPSELRSNLRVNNLIKNAEDIVEDLHEHRAEYCLRNPNIVDYQSSGTSYVNYVTSPGDLVPLEDSHHGFAISINFIDLVKYRSRLGYFLHYHQRTGNTSFISKCMVNSKIRNIAFYRHRVVNKPYEINERQSLVYSKYDENEYGDYIVSSSDRDADNFEGMPAFKNRLLEARSARGNLEEVEIVRASREAVERGTFIAAPSPQYSRQFIVKDRDLFHNINYGKYSYMVKINLRDGIQIALKDEYDSAVRFLKSYQDFLFNAQIPFKNTEEAETGNYNYNTKSFTQEFRSNAMNQRYVDGLVGAYINLKTLLSVTTEEELQEETAYLRNRLSLNSGNLQDLIEFYEIVDLMRISLKNILSAGVALSSERKEENYISSVENSTGGDLSSIEVLSKTNIVAEAIAKETIVADYNPTPSTGAGIFTDINIFRENIVNLTDGMLVVPSQFLELDTVFYDIEDEPSIVSAPRVNLGIIKVKRKKVKPKRKHLRAAEGRTIVTYSGYMNSSGTIKTNTNLKLEYLIRSQNDDVNPQFGETKKPDSYFPYATQRYYGGITLGLSGGTVNNFSGGIGYFYDVLDFMRPGLSDEVKKSICDSVYKEDDREFFLDEIERRYEDLVKARELMGTFFDYVHNSLLTKDLVALPTKYNVPFEDKYKGRRNAKVEEAIKKSNIFKHHGRRIMFMSPNSDPYPINLGTLNIQKDKLVSGGKKVICLKMETHELTTAPAVNNVVFLEV